MKEVMVADIMTHDPVTVKPDENLFNCAKKMVRKRVGSLPIVKDKILVGFLTQHDILWALIKKSKTNLSEVKAKDISAKKIATIKPTASIREALDRMNKKKYDKLPVVESKKLVGIITAKDILNFNPEVYPELEEFARIRDEQEKMNRIKGKNPIAVEDGICEECGETAVLYRSNGMLVCGDCRDN